MAERAAMGVAIVAVAVAIATGILSDPFPETYWLTVGRDSMGELEARICDTNWQNCTPKNPSHIFRLEYDGSVGDSGSTTWNIKNDTTPAMDITFGDFIASQCPVKFNGNACETTQPNVQPGASTTIVATNYQYAAADTYNFVQTVKVAGGMAVPIDPQLEMEDINPFAAILRALLLAMLSGAAWWYLRRRRRSPTP